MKGGVFDRPECCNQPCQCPVCYENKLLMRLNCNHYICLDDIRQIIDTNRYRRERQICPMCRTLITSYGCNGNITNVANQQPPPPNVIPYQEGNTSGEDSDNDSDWGNEYTGPITDDEDNEANVHGGKRKKYSRKNRKTKRSRKNRKTKRSRKNIKKRKI